MRRKRTTRFITALLVVSTGLMAGAQGALARPSEPSKHPSVKKVTTTTVMGGGSPSTWPAAKPKPPSLAGAYSPNMKTAFLALVRYSDWVGTHPNPKLVTNYATPASNVYAAQVYLMTQMAKRHLHLPPTPSQIDFIAVIKRPTLRYSKSGVPLTLAGKRAYTPGTIYAVIQQVTEPYLNESDHIVGYTTRGTGPVPWKISIVQRDVNAQFVIDGYYALTVHESLQKWERSIEGKR